MTTELGIDDTHRPPHFLFPHESISTQAPADDEVINNLLESLRATVTSANPVIARLARSTLKRVQQIQGAAALSGTIERVAWACHVPVEDLASHKRTQRLAFCRQIAFYVCRTVTGASYPAIAKSLNHDHSTVLHGYRLVEQRMQRDSAFRLSIHQLEARVADTPRLTEAAA